MDDKVEMNKLAIRCLLEQISKRNQSISLLTSENKMLEQNIVKYNEAIQALETKVGLLITSNQKAQKDILERDLKIDALSRQVPRIEAIEDEVSGQDNLLSNLSSQLQEIESKIIVSEDVIHERDLKIFELTKEIQETSDSLQAAKQEIEEMQKSMMWQMTMRFHRGFVEKALPYGSRRYGWYVLGLKGGRTLVSEGPKKTIYKIKDYIELNKNLKAAQAKDIPTIYKDINAGGIVLAESRYLLDQFARSSEKSPDYIPYLKSYLDLTDKDIKLIAFYLPQYHPIPENDEWWGKGFTDWRNVSKAVPQFVGHYQPHLPDELGFYDLRLIEVQKQQIELAKNYGVYGFCFHYYWFNGKRLLEKPLNQFISHPELDFPFCICWANENWTRRWDGMENEVLIAQTHSPENDIEFIKDLAPLFRDPRYIRINGRPILIVYRVPLLPDAKATAKRWRDYCREQGFGELYLIAAQTFGFKDPRECGFDAAVEFPPHTMPGCPPMINRVDLVNPNSHGEIFDFDGFVKAQQYLQRVPYNLFKAVVPGWDNTARRPNNGSIFHGSNPQNYKEWLGNVAEWTREAHPPEERIVFINAMNEWGEGAHLEPDLKYGYAYLQSTLEVVRDYHRRCVLGLNDRPS
jgi:hypothetical protein